MTQKHHRYSDPEPKPLGFLRRAFAVTGTVIAVAVLLALVLLAGWVLAFVTEANLTMSQTAASWAQAVGAPVAIAAAFFVARYQANRQKEDAAEQRRIAEIAANAATVATAQQARLDALEREAATLVYVHGTFVSAAGMLNPVFESMRDAVENETVGQTHSRAFRIAQRTFERLEPALIIDAHCQADVVIGILSMETMATYFDGATNMSLKAAFPLARILIAKQISPMVTLEDRIREISAALVAGGRSAVAPVYDPTDRPWRHWWAETAEEVEVELQNIVVAQPSVA